MPNPTGPHPVRLVLLVAHEPDPAPGEAPDRPASIPGELTLLRQRFHLTQRIPLPAAYRPLYASEDHALLALVTGVGPARAAASVTALGLDPRFDLTRAHFLLSGVAGIAPDRGTLASVVLPRVVVSADLTHELDAREIPASPAWPDGFVPIGKSTPYEQPFAPRFNADDGLVFPLHAPLVAWARTLAATVPLLDTPALAARRALYPPGPAHAAPSVLPGDLLASATFFHGTLLAQRARRWMTYCTAAPGREPADYVLTAMEDAAILQSLAFLAAAGRVAPDRTLIVRAASNFDRQRPGITAAQSLVESRVATNSGYRPALENIARVLEILVPALLAAWPHSPAD